MLADYFDDDPKYREYYFSRRYRMSTKHFLEIVEGISTYTSDPISEHFQSFRVRPDATCEMSIIPIIKCTFAIRHNT